MVGTASRKENSTMVSREIPSASPPMMVAPLRETPGIMATDWATPTSIASFHVSVRAGFGVAQSSTLPW